MNFQAKCTSLYTNHGVSMPQHIILFFCPIILFSNFENHPLSFLQFSSSSKLVHKKVQKLTGMAWSFRNVGGLAWSPAPLFVSSTLTVLVDDELLQHALLLSYSHIPHCGTIYNSWQSFPYLIIARLYKVIPRSQSVQLKCGRWRCDHRLYTCSVDFYMKTKERLEERWKGK